MKRLTVLVTVILLVMAIATPAMAVVSKHGTKNCGDNLVGIRSYSIGYTIHNVSAPSFYNTGVWNNGPFLVRRSATNHYSVDWNVYVYGGVLDDPGTYAYCTGIT